MVKPSGPEFHGSIGITCHNSSDVTSITSAVTSLLEQLEPRHSVLLESFVDTLTPKMTGMLDISKYIRKTYLYDFDPLKSHFYIVKLGFTGVYMYIIFLISAQKQRLWYSL